MGDLITNTFLDCDGHQCSDHVQIFKPVEAHYPDSFSGAPKFKNDIGMVKMDRDAIITGMFPQCVCGNRCHLWHFQFTDWVRPICLPYGEFMSRDYIGRRATVCKFPKHIISVDGHSPIDNILGLISGLGHNGFVHSTCSKDLEACFGMLTCFTSHICNGAIELTSS